MKTNWIKSRTLLRKIVRKHKISQQMSKKENCHGNFAMGIFFGSLKAGKFYGATNTGASLRLANLGN
jgi:transposase InsO family protein